jgi:hypothetical protein
MRRREIIKLLGGATVSWPRSQRADRFLSVSQTLLAKGKFYISHTPNLACHPKTMA